MSSLIQAWRNALSDKVGMAQASWEPFTQSIELGDFGEFDDDVFQHRRSCRAWGIDVATFKIREERSGQLEIISNTILEIAGGAGGSAAGAKVSATARFERSDAFLFRAPSYMTIEFEDPVSFGRALYDAAAAAGEAPSLMTYAVYGIAVVAQGYIVGSSDKNSSVGLTGRYDEIELGAVSGSLDISKTSDNQITTWHPGAGVGADAAVFAFKVLSWNASGRSVQLNANT